VSWKAILNAYDLARPLEHLALAYRYTVGGQQPGGVTIEK
jgi:hypothetical protein